MPKVDNDLEGQKGKVAEQLGTLQVNETNAIAKYAQVSRWI